MSILTVLSDGIIKLISQLASDATGPTSRVLRVLPLDNFGNVISGGSGGGSTSIYRGAVSGEAANFKVVRTSATVLTLSEMTFHAVFSNFLEVWEFDGDNLIAKYEIQDTDFDWTWAPAADKSGGTLTLDTATFDATSTFVVIATGPPMDDLDLLTILGGPGIHRSKRDFDAVRTDVEDITIGGVTPMMMDPDKDDFIAVKEFTAAGHERMTYTRREWTFTWAPGAAGEGVLSIAGATLQAGSSVIVYVQGPEHNTKILSGAGDATVRGKIIQHQDQAGKIQPAGADAVSAIHTNLVGLMGMVSGDGMYVSPTHFTATQHDGTKINLFGGFPVITNVSQIQFIVQISNAKVVTYHYPHVGFAWDGGNNRITVTGATFVGTDIFVVVIRGANRYANDPGNHLLAARVNADRLASDDQGVELLGTPLALTVNYQDIGPRISCFGFTMLELGITIDINLSTGLQLRALPCFSQSGVEEYSPIIETPFANVVKIDPAYWEDNTNADKLIAVPFPLSGAIPYVQVQARVTVVGGTAAELDYVERVLGWGGVS